ncbi:MAG: PD-(D/E)XK nuclease family protein [Candidatus Methanoplasma sp.]|jgi:CRISPR/Cas system-associated exonuclease Cas4 (RecB family)|nr:PD-(D/E)XK nuclease family protein [Candidatus Methanoplasma sp.]
MALSVRSKQYKIPSYSLTGDLLAFMQCKLQYRYNNKGALPPSTPVQQWFGEFIHGVMEESFLIWKKEKREFPWSFGEVQEISLEIANRLSFKGLKPYSNLFCDCNPDRKGSCPDNNHPHHLLANDRAFYAINMWGKYLFPLIDENEVKLEGMRDMPNYQNGVSRAEYYSVTGIADVVSLVNVNEITLGNHLVKYLYSYSEIRELISRNEEFEIIIDYKGMRRPANNSEIWKHHEWQLHTYMWLREEQLRSENVKCPIVAGILLYLNELCPSADDCKVLLSEIKDNNTDIIPNSDDISILENGDKEHRYQISDPFKEARSIRIIPYNKDGMIDSLEQFDSVVRNIESCVLDEMKNTRNVMSHWCGNVYEKRRCTACDLKTICIDLGDSRVKPKVP